MQPRASIDGEECSRIAGEKDPAGHRRNSPFTARMSNSIQSGPAKVSVQRKVVFTALMPSFSSNRDGICTYDQSPQLRPY